MARGCAGGPRGGPFLVYLFCGQRSHLPGGAGRMVVAQADLLGKVPLMGICFSAVRWCRHQIRTYRGFARGPYQSPDDPFVAAVHNAGRALGCLATGRSLQSAVTGQLCEGNSLGLTRGSDRFSWAVICWSGPATEAVSATRSDTTVREAAERIWGLYEAGLSGGRPSGDYPGLAATDPSVLALALSIADANWTSIERIAFALTGSTRWGRRVSAVSPALVRDMIEGRDGADIAAAFGIWEPAIAQEKANRRRPDRLRVP